MMRVLSSACLVLSAAALLGACAPKEPESAQATEPAPVVVASAPTIKLPVSINAIMVALVDHASEPLWVDAYVAPTTEERWKEAEYNAYQVAVGGKLIMLEGTGPNDAAWIADPAWKSIADEMSAAGMEALAATQARNAAALNQAGDRLVAACEDCHKKFKPDLPTMGLYKSPNYPPKTE
jgi:hypothetical protein